MCKQASCLLFPPWAQWAAPLPAPKPTVGSSGGGLAHPHHPELNLGQKIAGKMVKRHTRRVLLSKPVKTQNLVWAAKTHLLWIRIWGSQSHGVCAAVYLVAEACPCPVQPMPPHAQLGQSGQSVTKSRHSWRPSLVTRFTRDPFHIFACAKEATQPHQKRVLVCPKKVRGHACEAFCDILIGFKPQTLFVGSSGRADNIQSIHLISFVEHLTEDKLQLVLTRSS